ncbi:ABC transporter permease [Paenirhodobacter sp.]|uniref:ABC transporter permease n=1 Tax=Paenirhodobacter sp. TaxID=1965326 RepID=UPI003B3DE4A6
MAKGFIDGFDQVVDDALFWLSDHAAFIFDGIRAGLDAFYGAVLAAVSLPPAWAVAVAVGLIGWWAAGRALGVMALAGLLLCWGIGLWPETMDTLALVISAVAVALVLGLPLGVLEGYMTGLDRLIEPVLDLVQTLPPYIYLLPAIALLGFGSATALVATIIVAMPPVIRLTALGIRQVPGNFIELGAASGVTGWQMFTKIRLPFALPSIMAGINQGLMMAFGMVVIAGIVGAGGLGRTIYEAIRTLDIARSVDAAIAIVVLTMIIDRITQSLVPAQEKN